MHNPPLVESVITAAPKLPNLHLITFGDMNAHEVLMNYIDKVLNRISQLIVQNTPFVIVLPLNGASIIAMDLLKRADPTTAQSIRRSMRFVSKASPGLGTAIPAGTKAIMLDEIIDRGDTLNAFLENTEISPSDLAAYMITSKVHTQGLIADLQDTGVLCQTEVCFPNMVEEALWITCGAGLDQGTYPEDMRICHKSLNQAVAVGLLERFCTQFYGRLADASIDDWTEYIELLKANLRGEYSEALIALCEGGLNALPPTTEGEIIRYLYLMDSTKDYSIRCMLMEECLNLVVNVYIEA